MGQLEDLQISGFSLPDGTLEFCRQLNSKTMTYKMAAVFSGDGKMLCVAGENAAYLYDLEGESLVFTYQTDDGITCPTLTENGRYLLWLEEGSLMLLRVETGETESVALPEQFDVGMYRFNDTLLLGQNGLVILYDDKGEILFYDIEKSEFLESFPAPSGSEIALLGNKSELLVAYNEAVSLYDLSTGKCESTLALPCMADALVTDAGSDAFAVYRSISYSSGNDDGWVMSGYCLISIDEMRNMHLTVFVDRKGFYDAVSPSGGEIVEKTSEGFTFTQLLNFEQLLEIALGR